MVMIGAWPAHGFAMFSVIEKESGRRIGRLGPWQPDGWPGHKIGWAEVIQAIARERAVPMRGRTPRFAQSRPRASARAVDNVAIDLWGRPATNGGSR
jgi:hypothetical protein